jgi:hypothetical protein
VSEADDLAFMGLTEVAQAIASRELSALEVTQACLQRAALWQASRKAFIRMDTEPAWAAARRADAQLAQRSFQPGPLHGVPLAHKDLFYRAGQVSTCGSLIRRDWRAGTTASCLSKLDEAGAMDLGTLNMSEFAGGPTGHNIHHGHCASAYHPEHIAGGSSSGSGVAVGAGLVASLARPGGNATGIGRFDSLAPKSLQLLRSLNCWACLVAFPCSGQSGSANWRESPSLTSLPTCRLILPRPLTLIHLDTPRCWTCWSGRALSPFQQNNGSRLAVQSRQPRRR